MEEVERIRGKKVLATDDNVNDVIESALLLDSIQFGSVRSIG